MKFKVEKKQQQQQQQQQQLCNLNILLFVHGNEILNSSCIKF